MYDVQKRRRKRRGFESQYCLAKEAALVFTLQLVEGFGSDAGLLALSRNASLNALLHSASRFPLLTDSRDRTLAISSEDRTLASFHGGYHQLTPGTAVGSGKYILEDRVALIYSATRQHHLPSQGGAGLDGGLRHGHSIENTLGDEACHSNETRRGRSKAVDDRRVVLRRGAGPLIRSAWGQDRGLRYHALTHAHAAATTSADRSRSRSRSPAAHQTTRLALQSGSTTAGGGMDGGARHGELVQALVSIRHDDAPSDAAAGGGAGGNAAAIPAGGVVLAAAGGRSRSSSVGPKGADRVRGYVVEESVGAGAYGEVWRAHAVGAKEGAGGGFVLKRLFVERGQAVRRSGLREIHFGQALAGTPHVCRFVEAFDEAQAVDGEEEMWLVFCDEGLSLQHFLYQAFPDGCSLVHLASSELWKALRATPAGQVTLRELMRQLVEGVSALHAHNVSHRDLKPANLIVHVPPPDDAHGPSGCGPAASAASRPMLKIADFGSAVSQEAESLGLFGPDGPTQDDLTLDYAPPEVLFGSGGATRAHVETAYDMWSIGVIFLELVLGTSKVFQVEARTRAIIDQRMRDYPPEVREQAYLLRAMVELRVYPPRPDDAVGAPGSGPAAAAADAEVLKVLKEKDEAGLGLPNLWAVKLLRRLLRWNPADRLTARQALAHAYFREDGRGYECPGGGGAEAEFPWTALPD